MISFDVQIHGYRKGHQLLSSSVNLSKEDQSTIDRLSDVAGPLRPREHFNPYLTTYPLPSGEYNVIARTWQDLSAGRAGCVKTKSLIVSADVWSSTYLPAELIKLLNPDRPPEDNDAKRIALNVKPLTFMTSPPTFNASELMEALFLEETKPIVVFDVQHAESVCLRLLAALWPELRRRFALSTFSLSPRKIAGRYFDVVFCPSDAKSRFTDWEGRRIDGRIMTSARHRWTESLVQRVFMGTEPTLLSRKSTIFPDRKAQGSSGELRLALLWEELIEKLPRTPVAMLGLLDLSSSGKINKNEAQAVLEPLIITTVHNVAMNFSDTETWGLILALNRKLEGQWTLAIKAALSEVITELTVREPESAFRLLEQPSWGADAPQLMMAVAKGLAESEWKLVRELLMQAPLDVTADLIILDASLAQKAGEDRLITGQLENIITNIDKNRLEALSKALLPTLVHDWQWSLAKRLINVLEPQEIMHDLQRRITVTSAFSERIIGSLIERSRLTGTIMQARMIVLMFSSTSLQERLVRLTLKPVKDDVNWLMKHSQLTEAVILPILMELLNQADKPELISLFSDKDMEIMLTSHLMMKGKILLNSRLLDVLTISSIMTMLRAGLTRIDTDEMDNFIQRCLHNRFGGDEIADLSFLMGLISERADCERLIHEGFACFISADIASRNMIVFNKAPSVVRIRLIEKVDYLATNMKRRRNMDFTGAAYHACAQLMFDAEKLARPALIRAAGILVPLLLRDRFSPVSGLLAALFPVAYVELSHSSDVPDSLRFMFAYFDWDRCKTARKELIRAFISSNWAPGDFALIACKCQDASKIFKQMAKTRQGEQYLSRIMDNLYDLNSENRLFVKRMISDALHHRDDNLFF